MKRKVIYAKLQTGVFVPGAGDLGTVFPPKSKTFKELSMELSHADSLIVKFKYNEIKMSLMIPAANVVVASFVEETNKEE
jgi:hypothetical protein